MAELKEANRKLKAENDDLRMKLAHANLDSSEHRTIARTSSDVVTHL